MPATHRPNPQTAATIYRVYQMPESIRIGMHQSRAKRKQTVPAFLQESVEVELPKLIGALRELGIASDDSRRRPAKLPLSDAILAQLREGSTATGLPQAKLLFGCLRSAASRKRRAAKRRA